jgi:hypothetical protein
VRPLRLTLGLSKVHQVMGPALFLLLSRVSEQMHSFYKRCSVPIAVSLLLITHSAHMRVEICAGA